MTRLPTNGPVLDALWRMAAERHAMFERRLFDAEGPWTADPILAAHRFTNAYRVLDRVSQHLVRDVQYGEHRSQAPAEVFFRTILFKIFNKIDVWTDLESRLGQISWQATDPEAIAEILDQRFAAGRTLYSAAYIMAAPSFGHARKHRNHIALLNRMMYDGLPAKVASAPSLEHVYQLLAGYSGIGRFLAFQYAIDLNYSSMLNFDEQDFVVAGPGALDGLSKCFPGIELAHAETVIHAMTDAQEDEFGRLGISFGGLWGRRLQPIDVQNLCCETSKYSRVSHPDVVGVAGRSRIKQSYGGTSAAPLDPVFLPPRWGVKVPEISPIGARPGQLSLL